MATDFILGWSLTRVLGEGAFGEVKLLVNQQNGEVCAMKEVRACGKCHSSV
jgi:serine/threonine protein kinase